MKNARFPLRLVSVLLPLAVGLGACSGEETSETPQTPGTSGQGTGGATGGTAGAAGKATGGAAGSAVGGAAGKASGGGGQGGTASGGKIACETTNDCVSFIPETKPAGCAKAVCDAAQKFCRFVAKDLDGDLDPSNSCQSQDGKTTIELGGDCDEGDDKVNSKAWDGPAGLYKGEQKPDRCNDGIDNDCNGKVDDSALDDGTTCKCKPGDVRKCSEDSAGKKILYPGGAPQGECKYGNQTCDDAGKWGPCTNAVGPVAEECNGGKDDDCDGKADDLDDSVSNQLLWFCDGDSDNFAAAGVAPVKSCEVPTQTCPGPAASWKLDLPATDCNDARADVNPNVKEICLDKDGKAADENCNGLINEICTCKDDETQICFVDPTNQLIPHNGDVGVGECKPGLQKCVGGQWGPCLGGKGPEAETCANQNKDNDCDGDAKEANGAKFWYWDSDGDGHGDKNIPPVFQCDAPPDEPDDCKPSATTNCTIGPDKWRPDIPNGDCNDKDATVNPQAKEICDEIDNNCNGTVDEGATDPATWYFDGDGDGHVVGNTSTKVQCKNPGKDGMGCSAGVSSCPELWLTSPITKEDCADGNATVHPGAWDGPAVPVRPHGIVSPGLAVEFFKIPAYPAIPDLTALAPEPQTRIDVTVNHSFGLGAIAQGLPTDIAARWTGSITVPQDGEYTFFPQADDGVRLWVGDLGTPIVNDWTSHGPTEFQAKVALTKGAPIPIKLEWFDHHTGGMIVLRWQGPGFPKQPLTVALNPTPEQQIDRCNDNLNNDCTGAIDDGLIQTGGAGSILVVGCTKECDPIPVGLENVTKLCGNPSVGICHEGAQFCRPDGTWSPCAGEQTPQVDVCDGLDNNCDGNIDEGVKVEHCRDADKDGYCDLAFQCGNWACPNSLDDTWKTKANCPSKTDCNDSDGNYSPGKEERCDGLDNNCSNSADETFPDKGATCYSGIGACQASGSRVCSSDQLGTVCNAVPSGPKGCSSSPWAKPDGTSTWDMNCDTVNEICDSTTDSCTYWAASGSNTYCYDSMVQIATAQGISNQDACNLLAVFKPKGVTCGAPQCGGTYKTVECVWQLPVFPLPPSLGTCKASSESYSNKIRCR